MDFLLVSMCFKNDLPFVSDSFQFPCWYRLELLLFLIHCSFRIWNFYRLRHRNELLNQSVMIHRCISSACDVTFMMLWRRSLHSWPCGFMRFHYTTISRFCERHFQPKGQTPQLAECQWDIAPMISTWRKKYRSRFR